MSGSSRENVAGRALGKCEYCLYPDTEALIPHQLDHIIARQHGGSDDEGNLAYSCAVCNRYKGPNLSSIDPQSKELTPLFNPRTQRWSDHFALEDATLMGLTPEGRTTAFLLHFNDEARLAERRALISAGRYRL